MMWICLWPIFDNLQPMPHQLVLAYTAISCLHVAFGQVFLPCIAYNRIIQNNMFPYKKVPDQVATIGKVFLPCIANNKIIQNNVLLKYYQNELELSSITASHTLEPRIGWPFANESKITSPKARIRAKSFFLTKCSLGVRAAIHR